MVHTVPCDHPQVDNEIHQEYRTTHNGSLLSISKQCLIWMHCELMTHIRIIKFNLSYFVKILSEMAHTNRQLSFYSNSSFIFQDMEDAGGPYGHFNIRGNIKAKAVWIQTDGHNVIIIPQNTSPSNATISNKVQLGSASRIMGMNNLAKYYLALTSVSPH